MPQPEPFASLVQDHRTIAEFMAEVRGTAEEAVRDPDDAELVAAMLERLSDLEAFLANDLAIHIAKEEQVLFPALRTFAEEVRVVDEMVVQHDMVRERQSLLVRTLAMLDGHHDEVETERQQLAAHLSRAAAGAPSDVLTALLDIVRRLDWILQGHFGDEEDSLFAPSEALLSPDVLADLSRRMTAIGERERGTEHGGR